MRLDPKWFVVIKRHGSYPTVDEVKDLQAARKIEKECVSPLVEVLIFYGASKEQLFEAHPEFRPLLLKKMIS